MTKTPTRTRAAKAAKPAPALEPAVQPTPEPQPVPKPMTGKIGAVVTLLRRPEGASLDALMDATGWQAHSVRGALSGAIKKQRGLNVTSEKTEEGRVYCIPAQVEA